MATKAQIKKIHVLKSQLGLDDDCYRLRMQGYFGKESSKELLLEEAKFFIEDLEELMVRCGLRPPPKFSTMLRRPGMASPTQLRYIDSLWNAVSYQKTDEDKSNALRRFLENHFKVSDMRFVTGELVAKIIKALKNFKKKENSHESAQA